MEWDHLRYMLAIHRGGSMQAAALAPNMDRFAARFPGLTLEVRTGHSFLNLVRGEADIAVRNRPPDQQSLTMRRLGSVAISLWATRGYLDRFGMPDGADFAGHRMILFDESLTGMPGVRWLEGQIAGAQVVMRSNELLPLMAATRAGGGIGCFPAIAAADEPDLVAVAPGIIGLPEVYMITRRDLRQLARVKAVTGFIAQIWKQAAGELAGRAVAEVHGHRVAGFNPEPGAVISPSGSFAVHRPSSPATY